MQEAGPRTLRDTRHPHDPLCGDLFKHSGERVQRVRLAHLAAATVDGTDKGAQLLEVGAP